MNLQELKRTLAEIFIQEMNHEDFDAFRRKCAAIP